METKDNLKQVDGTHYEAPYQHWDLVLDLGLDYCTANATKYITRFEKKNGVKDLEKARSYLYKLLKDINKVYVPDGGTSESFARNAERLDEFLKCNQMKTPMGFTLKSLMTQLLNVYVRPKRNKMLFCNYYRVDQHFFVEDLKNESMKLIGAIDGAIAKMHSVSFGSPLSSGRSCNEGQATSSYVNQG
jgi:Protein of unknwon function (DUF3310)